MQDKDTVGPDIHSLKQLTPAEFMALGGSAVAFVRTISGHDLVDLLDEDAFEGEGNYQMVVSANGTPLMVTDSPETLGDWLAEHNIGLVSLH